MSTPERVPGYSFTDATGEIISVPAGQVTEASRYEHEAMTREQAHDIVIAFGVCTESAVPIRIRPAGEGFEAIVPLEFLREYDDVAAFLEGRRWR